MVPFETSDGKLFAIRVSNHNINAANVGDEPVESIVIRTLVYEFFSL